MKHWKGNGEKQADKVNRTRLEMCGTVGLNVLGVSKDEVEELQKYDLSLKH